jgi:hypothetical protein
LAGFVGISGLDLVSCEDGQVGVRREIAGGPKTLEFSPKPGKVGIRRLRNMSMRHYADAAQDGPMNSTVPGGVASIAESRLGTRGLRSASRHEYVELRRRERERLCILESSPPHSVASVTPGQASSILTS